MRASTRGQTGAVGETAVMLQFERLGWGVAPNPTKHDLGTDLWLDARDERLFALGALVGAQVKSGNSWFTSPSHNEEKELVGWWFSDTDGRHFKYWTDHRVPHLLVLHNPASDLSYWVHVTRNKVVSTGKGAKILVPVGNTIDENHFGELLQVAVGNRDAVRWEGSVWEGGKTVLRVDRLRYALLVPRLIAPHPNLTVTELPAEAALALLIKMRLRDLDPRNRRETKAPTLEMASSSEEWAWRLYAATYDAVVNGKGTGGIRALIDVADEPFERAAAAAITCALLIEAGEPVSGLEVVTCVLDRDDCEPVDHAWLLSHKARCLAELGELENAREDAVEVQGLRSIAAQDPTAMAIVGSSADLIFATSGWHSDHISAAITGRDTLAAWWRTQEVSGGLQRHWQSAFKQWARDTSTTFGASDSTWLHLRAASLIAGMTADHNSWRHVTGMLAQRVLTTADPDSDSTTQSQGLALLRQTGDTDSVKLAVQHLLCVGPARAVSEDAGRIDLAQSTRTSIRADLEMLRYAADVLPSEEADQHARWALKVLDNPQPLAERLTPTFHIPSIVLDTLAELVSTVSETVAHEVIEHVIALPCQDDQGNAHHYARLVQSIPDSSWTETARRALAGRDDQDNFELAGAITTVLASTDPGVREAQRAKIADGDLPALEAFGDVRDLDDVTVNGLVASLSAKITTEIEELKSGQSSIRTRNFAAILVLINVWHPVQADWHPIISLLSTKAPFTEHLHAPLVELRGHGENIPAFVVTELVPALRELMIKPPSRSGFFGSPDVRGDAAAALAAVSPEEITVPELWQLLNGDDQSRAAAVHVVSARNNPHDLTTLAVLARNSTPHVKAMVAFSLARWVAQDIAVQPALELLAHILDDPGTLVAKAVAARLSQTPPGAAITPLIAMLQGHQSSEVRQALHEFEQVSQ